MLLLGTKANEGTMITEVVSAVRISRCIDASEVNMVFFSCPSFLLWVTDFTMGMQTHAVYWKRKKRKSQRWRQRIQDDASEERRRMQKRTQRETAQTVLSMSDNNRKSSWYHLKFLVYFSSFLNSTVCVGVCCGSRLQGEVVVNEYISFRRTSSITCTSLFILSLNLIRSFIALCTAFVLVLLINFVFPVFFLSAFFFLEFFSLLASRGRRL